jgi:hypothetical protein
VITNPLTLDDLRSIEFFGEAVTLLREYDMLSTEDMEEITGFGHMPGAMKPTLVDIPFMIVQYSFQPGVDGKPFSELYLITTTHEKWRMRDSSKGIHSQLRQLHTDRVASGHPFPFNGVYVSKGLTFEEYPYTDGTGNTTMSRTYSLSY